MKRITPMVLWTLAVCSALDFQLPIVFAQGAYPLLTSFTNPTPKGYEAFGHSLAAMGTDRVLIGTPRESTDVSWSGSVYLFSTSGALITTFTNPAPGDSHEFGRSVTALGNDRVLIGAPGEDPGGAAYLFSTNGALLITYTNPTPAADDRFGWFVTAVGSDQVLIADTGDDTGAKDAGAAYLFSSNGTLLATITNPVPAADDFFGWSLAAVGTMRVLIGAPSTSSVDTGAAYLFSTDGTLITTFTNPTPRAYESFGVSVAALGTDRVLIGNAGGEAVYLFGTNGALLITITNPTPSALEGFGWSVTTMGSDQLLIGTPYEDRDGTDFVAAYLFNTNGVLLAIFTNPTSAHTDEFGFAVAAVGTDRVLVAAPLHITDGIIAGAAYLFSTIPNLGIKLTTTNTVAVSWPSPSPGWMLQENTEDLTSAYWSNAPGTVEDDGITKTFVIDSPLGNRFYRLIRP